MKCKVCGKRLNLKAENRYEIRKVPKGVRILTEDTVIYEAFDCLKCGCQNIVGTREEVIFKDIKNADKELEQKELILCKNCKYFEHDSVEKVNGIPLIVAHEICSKWGEGCKTSEDGYCFLAEKKGEDKE